MTEKIKTQKRFTYVIFLLISVFILEAAPINFANAITQNQIKSLVQIVCPDKYGNWFIGSGTVIDPKGIILTNKHIVTDKYGEIINSCFIGLVETINQPPNFGTSNNPNLAEVKYYTTQNNIDAAILYLDNPVGKNYPYINIWDSNSNNLNLGDKIEVVGFPNVGGSTITYTSGVFSGFGSESNGTQNYLKTTAILEHGNSGGAAYNDNNQFIGIPTMAVRGTINSLGYILSINSIKSWLRDVLGSNYKQEIIKQEPIIQKPQKEVQQDITTPTFGEISTYMYFRLIGYDESIGEDINIYDPRTEAFNPNAIDFGLDKYIKGSYNRIKLATWNYTLWLMDRKSKIISIYYSVSKNLNNLNEKNEKKYSLTYDKYSREANNWGDLSLTPYIDLLDGAGTYYIGLRFQNESKNISERLIFEYIYIPIVEESQQNKKEWEEKEKEQKNLEPQEEIEKKQEPKQISLSEPEKSSDNREKTISQEEISPRGDFLTRLIIAFGEIVESPTLITVIILCLVILALVGFRQWTLLREKKKKSE